MIIDKLHPDILGFYKEIENIFYSNSHLLSSKVLSDFKFNYPKEETFYELLASKEYFLMFVSNYEESFQQETIFKDKLFPFFCYKNSQAVLFKKCVLNTFFDTIKISFRHDKAQIHVGNTLVKTLKKDSKSNTK